MAYFWSPNDWSSTELRGRPLRYLLVTALSEAGSPMTVRELIEYCRQEGVAFVGRPSKIISDALRWEVRGGRVRRLRRGVYARGGVPDSTRRWIAHRVLQLRVWLAWMQTEAARRFLADDEAPRSFWEWQGASWVPGWPCWPAPNIP